jgi:hypothetical protein
LTALPPFDALSAQLDREVHLMSEDFDPTPYVRPPVLDVASGVALGIALLTGMPKSAPDGARKAARKLRKGVEELQSAWAASGRSSGPSERRPADIRVDKAWAALHARLDAYSSLPADEHPNARRAGELVDIIYPEGLQFLTLPYAMEWAEGEKRLKLIDEEGIGAEIDALAGPEFLAEVRKAHKIYGEAIGVTKPAGEEATVNLVDPLRSVGRAITEYALQLIPLAAESSASADVVRGALRPIDEHRSDAAHRAAPAASPTTPLPEIPQEG